MDVNFEYYKVFYYVAKYKNFTKAAHALGSGQPNVTRAMNCLEQQTHCTLFIRTNRGVQLTPEGEMLFTHVEAAISQIQTAETELNAHSGLEHGSISIGASETALNIYLLDILKPFHMKHPGIRLKIYNHSTPQAIRSVKNGEVDFAVVSTPTNVDTSLKELHLRPFREILVGGQFTINGVSFDYGAFISAVLNFLIMAVILFTMVKAVNKAMSIGNKPEEEPEPEAPAEPEPTKEELLLTEIRDLLSEQNKK